MIGSESFWLPSLGRFQFFGKCLEKGRKRSKILWGSHKELYRQSHQASQGKVDFTGSAEERRSLLLIRRCRRHVNWTYNAHSALWQERVARAGHKEA